MRLLLVEDNVPLADELLAGLQRQGYAVDWLAERVDNASDHTFSDRNRNDLSRSFYKLSLADVLAGTE